MPDDEYLAVAPSMVTLILRNERSLGKMKQTPEQVEAITKALIDKGLLIEAGWIAFASIVYPSATEQQYEMLRQAFFAGAQHLFASIMNVLDPDENPTEDDMKRMVNISEELEQFIQKFKLQYLTPVQGNS